MLCHYYRRARKVLTCVWGGYLWVFGDLSLHRLFALCLQRAKRWEPLFCRNPLPHPIHMNDTHNTWYMLRCRGRIADRAMHPADHLPAIHVVQSARQYDVERLHLWVVDAACARIYRLNGPHA